MLNNVAIVIPYYREYLNNFEKLSWNSLIKFYPNHNKIAVMPRGKKFPINHPSILKTEYLDPLFFRSVKTTNEYLLNKQFYMRFIDYEYILIFELDCLIVKDQLNYWVNQNYSYIGAPSVGKLPFCKIKKVPYRLKYFNNGGFSLRKIPDFIKTFESTDMNILNSYTWRDLKKFNKVFKFLSLLTNSKKFEKSTSYFTRKFYLNEDVFWSYFAKFFNSNFKNVPINKINIQSHFAIDSGVDFIRKKIKYDHPFAYHKLFEHDLELWQNLTKDLNEEI